MSSFVEESRVPVGIVILGMVVGCIAAGTAVPYILDSIGGAVYLWEPQQAHLYFRTIRRAACFAVMATSVTYFLVHALRAKGDRMSSGALYGTLKTGCAVLVAMAFGSIAGAGLVALFPGSCEPLDVLRGWRIVQVVDLVVVILALPLLVLAFELMQKRAMAMHAWLPRIALFAVPLATWGCAFACREAVWAWSLRLAANE